MGSDKKLEAAIAMACVSLVGLAGVATVIVILLPR